MKENNKQVVFYNAEKDGFLKSYKDRETLVFEATFTDRLRDALYLPVEPYEEQKKLKSTNLLKRLTAKCLSWKLNTM